MNYQDAENQAAILSLSQLITVSVLQMGITFFCLMLKDCQRKGMILYKWHLYLRAWHIYKPNYIKWLAKPLGYCIYCFSPYVSILFTFLLFNEWYLYPFCIGLNYVYLDMYFHVNESFLQRNSRGDS